MRNSIGPYKIIEKIGLGGMGVVYKAEHEKIGQIVAIKAIPPYNSEDSYIRNKFLNEARLQARLSHSNIVNIINYIESDDSIFLVMEYINGETLEERIKSEGCIPYEEAVKISEKLLDALQYLHDRGIVHRDLKPSNIMFTDNGTVKVTDFGISKLVDQKGVTTTILAGSYTYMSPEEITGEGTTYYSDIYSYGITLYNMLCGKPPFEYDTEYRIMKAHLEEKPADPRKYNSRIPGRLSKAVLKSISKDPLQRYNSPSEFKSGLVNSINPEGFKPDFYFLSRIADNLIPDLNKIGAGYKHVALLILVFLIPLVAFLSGVNNTVLKNETNSQVDIPENNVLDEIVLMDLASAGIVKENPDKPDNETGDSGINSSGNIRDGDIGNGLWKIRK